MHVLALKVPIQNIGFFFVCVWIKNTRWPPLLEMVFTYDLMGDK
jgi:hypothetical protein